MTPAKKLFISYLEDQEFNPNHNLLSAYIEVLKHETTGVTFDVEPALKRRQVNLTN